ncbi:MAG: cation diffusion facilitator family transporter [Actinobacteria bacterium]|nr:cation diffusion facilitator family transporter [Actinomycetota bacterium]MBU1943170.1 cation diffusion facilitator family transporter [Actinomycetota bacterium]MBU2687848.1 cation diffusion facilitator family transporter [Actinomycetota bacterium]
MKLLSRMEPAEKAEGIDTIASVFMAAGMIALAAVSGSVSVLAEGIDTCVDIVAAIAVMIGLKLSRRKSRDFPDGLFKLENLVAVGIGVLILFSAYALARESIQRLLSKQVKISDPWVAIITMAVVVVVTGLLAWYKGSVGRKVNSPSLKADSRHSWTDTIASAGVIVGVALNAAGVHYVDSIMALVIVVILAWSGGQVIVDAFKVLLDASIEKEVLDAAARAAEEDPRVLRVVRVEGRNSGSYRFLHVIIVPEAYDLKDAEATAEGIRKSIRSAVQNVESVQVDFASEEVDRLRVAVPLASDKSSIAGDLDSADFYALLALDPEKGALEDTSVLQNPVAAGEGRAIKLAVALAQHGAHRLLVRGDVPTGGPAWVLDANDIDVIGRSDISTLNEARASVASLLEGRT